MGFLFNQQSTKYELGGTTNVDLADVSVYNYHGYLAYNFGDSDATVRPYVLGGLGATQFGSVSVTAGGVTQDLGGNTQFSSTWAAGVKLFPSPQVRPPARGPVDPDLHQVGLRGLVVRPLLGLLRGFGRPVREPVRAERRHHAALLEAAPRRSRATTRPAPGLAGRGTLRRAGRGLDPSGRFGNEAAAGGRVP